MLAGAEELEKGWEAIHRLLKEAGDCECCECLDCAKQKAEAEKVDLNG